MTTLTQHAPGTPSWYELTTSDGEAAKDFYNSLFGWTSEDNPVSEDMTYTMHQLDGRNVAASFEMTADMAKQGIQPHWRVFFTVEDAQASADLAKEAGGKVMAGPFDVFTAGVMAVIQDPQGAVFNIWQPKEQIGVGVKSEIGAVGWTEYLTKDREMPKAFYTKIFPFTALDEKMANGQDYTVMKLSDEYVAGVLPMNDEQMKGVPCQWCLYFMVDDIEASIAKAKAKGGDAFLEKTDIQHVFIAGIKDPQGAAFMLMEPKPRQGEDRPRNSAAAT